MRQVLPALLLALSPCVIPATSLAADAGIVSVQEVESLLALKQAEMDASASQVADQKMAVKETQTELSRMESLSSQLDKKLKTTKAALDRDYSRISDEPEFDIRPSQGAYQAAWAEVKLNQQKRLEISQQLEEQYAELSLFETDQKRINAELENLESQELRARVARLRDELGEQQAVQVEFTNACKASMTLAQCANQTKGLALQKAVNSFQNQLISTTTEAKLVQQHLTQTSLNIHVVGQKTTQARFTNNNRYLTSVDVMLQARPAKNAACKMLNIDSQFCFDKGEELVDNTTHREVPWVTLTVRSNQYQDRVAIDGVSYGSTPLDIMLPVGPHVITISKEGYRSFNQELKISGDHTLRAVLTETENVPHSGRKFADALPNKSTAPEMIVIGAGEYLVGENSAKQVNIKTAYSMSATPVTVAQFEAFVNNTGYQTDAELKKVCTTVDELQIVPVTDSYWRNPGFKQSSDSPVVCVSQKDAQAYTKWLSSQTGFQYLLPTEIEWEVAALAGAQSAYWWGDSFGSGQANTGWGGTQWSNTSTSPVRTFAPNNFGLFDTVGNVWEWTNDERSITKGGAWSFSPNQATAHSRLYLSPNTASNYVGFRILRRL